MIKILNGKPKSGNVKVSFKNINKIVFFNVNSHYEINSELRISLDLEQFLEQSSSNY